jgi:hypothetical protein
MVLAPGHPPSLRYGGQSAHLLAIKIQYTLTDLFHLSNLYRNTPGFDKTCTRPPSPRLRRLKDGKNHAPVYASFRRGTAYPPFPTNDKLQPDLRILLWPELRRVTQHRDRLAPSLKLPERQFLYVRPPLRRGRLSILPGR